MKRRISGGFLWILVFVVCVLVGGPVSASPQESPAPALDLSTDVESPGFEVTITLNLVSPEGVDVGKAVSEISYPGNLLSFVEAIRGLSAEAAGAQVTAVEETAGDTTTVRVTVEAGEGDGIPQGVLADLRFKISEEAPADETVVPLINKVSAWSSDVPPAPIGSVTGKDGQVTISANPPVFACFFYMH